jgi:predicted MPP superfamily phosphohydrolase
MLTNLFDQFPFIFLVTASTFVDAAVACFVLFRAPSRSLITFPRVVRTASITGLVFVLKLLLLSRIGVHHFGLIHLVYVELVVLVPAVGTIALLASLLHRRQLTTSARVVAFGSLALAAVGIDASWIEPFRLRLETARVDVSPRRTGTKPFKIAVLTDLQTTRVTDYERSAVALLMAQQPDVILLPGDVFQGTRDDFNATLPALRELLGRLKAPGGVYLVLGDTDGPGYHLMRDVLPFTDVKLLVNDSVQVDVGDRRLTIGGVELKYDSREAQALVEHLDSAEGEDHIRIVLAHRPDVVLGLRPNSRIDLVVAGHTHGGQIVIPGFGPPMTLTHVPRNVAAGGLHTIDGNAIYVSRGVGCERGQAPRIRFFCPPEISLIEIGGPR